MTREHDAAVGYAQRGWRVFPVGPDKRPLTAHGFHDATDDVKRVAGWWAEHPESGIGWAVPPPLFVLDVDARHRGHESLAELEGEHGKLPPTLSQITGGGGLHLVYRLPPGVKVRDVRQLTGLRAGIDTRLCGRGYVVLPPSLHGSGLRYAWKDRVPPAGAPAWLVNLIRVPPQTARSTYAPAQQAVDAGRAQRYALRALEGEAQAVAATPAGTRNHRLVAAWLRCAVDLGNVLPREIVRGELTRAALAAGLSEEEIRRTLRDDLADGRRAA